jgi:1,4-dihydroxy-2-naphthoate octaprenyltransferase
MLMTYLMAAGLVKYVRILKGWSLLIQGAFFLLLITLSLEFLILLQSLTLPVNRPQEIRQKDVKTIQIVLAAVAATMLTLATTLFFSWLEAGILWQGLVFLLIALFVVSAVYYLAHFSTVFKPFVLLIEVLLFVVIPPALAFFLHSDDLHPYLTLIVISLVPAFLANRLLNLLENYSYDQKHNTETLIGRIGWEKVIFFHNAFILLTYFLIALIAVLGVHWFIIWPVFLTLPIGLVEIWLMDRVRRGAKPMWRVMRIASACVYFLPIYLIGFAFWAH